MEKRIIALERKCAVAIQRSEALESKLDALTENTGENAAGKITFREVQTAAINGDKLTVQRY